MAGEEPARIISTDPNYLRGVAAGILLVAAALGAAEGAWMRLPVLPALRAFVVNPCYSLNCAGLGFVKCVDCCWKQCFGIDLQGCQDACLSEPIALVGKSAATVQALNDTAAELDAGATGERAIELAGTLAWNADHHDDLRVRAFALRYASARPLSAAMLSHNEQGRTP